MIKEFEIFIPDKKIEILNQKIDLTRWPDEINDERWTLGTKKSYLKRAVETWRNNFDWRKHEAKLNEAGSFKFKTKSAVGISSLKFPVLKLFFLALKNEFLFWSIDSCLKAKEISRPESLIFSP